ncbi:MAG: hypothetical protein U0641_18045 [Anaerolineae bacterium]
MKSVKWVIVGVGILALMLSATASAQGPSDGKSNGPAAINALAETFGAYVSGSGGYGLWVDNGSTADSAGAIVGRMNSRLSSPGSSALIGANVGNGWGVYGSSTWGWGLVGRSGVGIGVYGRHDVDAGPLPGVWGDTVSTDDGAAGVIGRVFANTAGDLSVGVKGVNAGTNNKGFGVWGSHLGGGTGVVGTSSAGDGVYAETGGGGMQSAVYGLATGSSGTGVKGEANNGSAAYGVWGKSTSGYAGYFNGNVRVIGTLSKSAGAFKIDHPLDPANKYLSHSFVESPDMMNVYNGNATLDEKGEAWVALPDWFEALNRDFRYQLTAIGAPGPNLYVAAEVADHRFKIAGGSPNGKVSWQVTGIRHDAYARAHPIVVEEDKPAAEKGYYLHPDLFGQADEKSIEAAYGKPTQSADKAMPSALLDKTSSLTEEAAKLDAALRQMGPPAKLPSPLAAP